MSGAQFHEGLQCYPIRLEYDYARRIGSVVLEPGHCTDMSGCIKVFTAIDPSVRDIFTFSGERGEHPRKDMRYSRDTAGKWHASHHTQTP